MSRYRGIYINLDGAVQRRAAMERQFSALNLNRTYSRLPAVDGCTIPESKRGALTAAEVGCMESHRLAWSMCAKVDIPFHVIEDDVRISPHGPKIIEDTMAGMTGTDWDVIYTDVMISDLHEAMETACAVRSFRKRGAFGTHEIKKTSISCTSSYVINPRSARKLTEIFSNAKRKYPVDLALREFINRGELSAFVTLPYLTALLPEAAGSQVQPKSRDIGNDAIIYDALQAFRASMYIDANMNEVAALFDNITGSELDGFEQFVISRLSRCFFVRGIVDK